MAYKFDMKFIASVISWSYSNMALSYSSIKSIGEIKWFVLSRDMSEGSLIDMSEGAILDMSEGALLVTISGCDVPVGVIFIVSYGLSIVEILVLMGYSHHKVRNLC